MKNKAHELYEADGFIEKFYSYLRLTNNAKTAYEYVEKLHKRYFGKRRYKNFESFRKSKEYHFKRSKA